MQRFVKRQSVTFQPIESLLFFPLTTKRARQVFDFGRVRFNKI